MSKTTLELPNWKNRRDELVTTVIEQTRTDPKILDEIADDIANFIQDGDEKNDQSIASQILGMTIQDKKFRQRVLQKVLEQHED